MKNKALFSSKDKVKNSNVVCCNFCLALQELTRTGPMVIDQV